MISSVVIVCLGTVVLFNLFTATEGRRCSMFTEFTIYDPVNPNAKETCRKCPKCPIGYGLPVQCGLRVANGTSTDCIPCPANTYSNADEPSACKPCNECDGKKVLKQCTPTQNRDCGTTCMDPHYYLDSENDECKECYFCCQDAPNGERLQQCKDIGMPINRQCKKTPKNEECKLALIKKTTPTPTASTVRVRGRVSTTMSNVENISNDLESPSKPPPAPIHENSENNSKDSPASANKDYKGYYIAGGVLGSIFIICITVKFRKNRRHSEGGNRADVESQDDEHEMSVLVHGPEGSTNSSSDRCDIETTPTLENYISEGVKLDKFPYYGKDFILKLDITSTGVKNWRHVACKFNVSNLDFQMMEQEGSCSPPRSPTRALIEKLCTLNVSLKRFVDVLQELQRHDVANDILIWYREEFLRLQP
ncbi:hypothetical protein ACROYT_G002155 [Oculina patagonica]